MSISEDSHELIQKYLDALASESELVELEKLLATDAEVAHAFAEMARLDANLEDYFRKQYKMDQVAALLNAPVSMPLPPPIVIQPQDEPGKSIEPPSPSRSTFTPRYTEPVKSRRGAIARQLHAVARRWKPIAIALLILVMATALWTAKHQREGGPRLISGRVTVGGRNATRIPENAVFEVASQEAAVIELPGGARIELVAATRAAIRHEDRQYVVKLESGGGDFHVQPDQPAFRVETALGVVTTNDGRFTLDLMTALPKQVSPTMPIELPRLTLVVAQGIVTVKHSGNLTTFSAGQEHVFVNSISS